MNDSTFELLYSADTRRNMMTSGRQWSTFSFSTQLATHSVTRERQRELKLKHKQLIGAGGMFSYQIFRPRTKEPYLPMDWLGGPLVNK